MNEKEFILLTERIFVVKLVKRWQAGEEPEFVDLVRMIAIVARREGESDADVFRKAYNRL